LKALGKEGCMDFCFMAFGPLVQKLLNFKVFFIEKEN